VDASWRLNWMDTKKQPRCPPTLDSVQHNGALGRVAEATLDIIQRNGHIWSKEAHSGESYCTESNIAGSSLQSS
jgi:hypothetical protein